MPDELNPRHLWRRLIELAAFVGVVALLVGALPGLSDVRQRFADADPWFIVLAGVLELASCLSYVIVFREVFCRRLPWGFSYNLALAEQGTNVLVPTGGAGGLALGAWALRQGGMPTEHIGRRSVSFFVFTSIPNFACAAIGGVLLAAHVLPGKRPLVPTIVLSALAALAMVAVAAVPRLVGFMETREDAGRLRRLIQRSLTALAEGVRDTGKLLWPPQPAALAGSIGYMGFDLAALAAAFAAFGSPPQFGALLFAYVIGQLGGLIPLPGGIGGTDGGLIGALVLYGSSATQAAAAVLVYRVFQLGLPAVLGTIGFTRVRREIASASAPAALCAPLAEPLPVVIVPRPAS
jgi:uncharacterized membrane protein YbhN (UPF0104 family)